MLKNHHCAPYIFVLCVTVTAIVALAACSSGSSTSTSAASSTVVTTQPGHVATTQAQPTSTSAPAGGGSWVDKAVLPPDVEAKIRAWLRADNFQPVYSELNRLSQDPKYRTNPRVYYLDIKAIMLEMRWARSQPAGDLRSQEQNRFLYDDYAGLMCDGSASWLRLFPSASAIGTFMAAVNKVAKDALAGRACHAASWSQYPGADALVKRLVELSNFEIAAEKIPFPADPGPGTS